jgi:hypothetical protein
MLGFTDFWRRRWIEFFIDSFRLGVTAPEDRGHTNPSIGDLG